MRAAPLLMMLAGLTFASGARASVLRLALNHSARLPVTGPASSVVVGSPSVIDVSVVDSRTVFVSGREAGSTDITIIDPLGRTVYHGEIVVGQASAVQVFRGARRSEETCAPYCTDGAGGGTAGSAGAFLAGRSSPATAPGASSAAALPISALNGALSRGAGSVASSFRSGFAPPR